MASLLHALIVLCQFAFMNYNGSGRLQSVSCVAVGYLFLMAALMKVCFGSWITFHLFCFAVLLKNMKKLEPLYVVSSILIPIAISSIPLTTKSYGPSGEWCMVQPKRCGANYAAGEIELLAVWFGPAVVLLVLQCIAMLTIIITVYYRAHRTSGENVFGCELNNIAFRQLLPLVAYPMLFCILITPPLIERVYAFASPTQNYGLLILLTICIPAWSFSAGVTLIVHITVLKRTEIMRLVFSMIRTREARDAVTITEEPADQSFPQDTSRLLGSNRDGTRSSSYFSIPTDI